MPGPDARLTELPRDRGLWLAFLCILAPLALNNAVFPLAFSGLGPDREALASALAAAASVDAVAEFARRTNFLLAGILLGLAATCALAYVAATLWAQRGGRTAAIVVAPALAAGVGAFVTDKHISDQIAASDALFSGALYQLRAQFGESIGSEIRIVAFNAVLEAGKASASQYAAIGDRLQLVTAWTVSFTVAAVAALALCFGHAALRPRPGAPAIDDLARRRRAFRGTLFLASLVLALAVATVRAFYQWQLALLTPESAERFGTVTSTVGLYWGTQYTLLIFAAAMPAALALHLDVSDEARRSQPDAPEDWLAVHGLAMAPREVLGGITAVAAPLLTSPVLDALKSLLGA